jgi:predicted nucleotidyltransferase component of viral defense system
LTPHEIQDIAASIRQRLLNKAKLENNQFDEMLRYYAIERFLYRLSKSQYSEKFVLKGALMLVVWEAPIERPTSDIDVLGRIENDIERLEGIFREVCEETVEADGLVFDSEVVKGEAITEQAEYPGVRIGMIARLGQAKAVFHIDVGFGDVVIPAPERKEYPVMLDMPKPVLLTYSRESAIAEKVEAIFRFGEVNSRMKDFYDIWLLAKTTSFGGNVLFNALVGTFDTRGTIVPDNPFEFFHKIAAEVGKQGQWSAFLKRSAITNTHLRFDDIVEDLIRFLIPPIQALLSDDQFIGNWDAGGPWE